MTLPGLVLVHGGARAADCWDLTVAELRRQAPDLRVLPVDLPGHGSKPADLMTVTIADWVDSVVADIEDAGLGEVVVAGHSMAGLTVPGVVAKLGSPRVREMILASAFVPPQGQALVDTLDGPLAPVARWGLRVRRPMRIPAALAWLAFCNGMTWQQRRFAMSRRGPEALSVLTEIADRSEVPDDVPRTWILTTNDRALPVLSQRRSIRALGGVDTTICIDTCHDLMISEPKRLAAILIERARLAASG
jgi:pimeloyl-ACP methyl ester carboxylesterase